MNRRIDRSRPRPANVRLPETAIVVVTGTDPDGDAVARPADWDRANGPAPTIFMAAEPSGSPALAPGERVLVRLKPAGPGRYEGRTLRRVADTPGRVLGIYQRGRIVPTDRRSKAEWLVPPGSAGGAVEGEIVLAEPLPHARLGLKPARVIERLGAVGDARSISLIAIHTHDIPQEFPPAALEEAETCRAQRRWAGAPTSATCRWSPSTARTRATSTMRCSPSLTTPAPRGLPPRRRHRRCRPLRPPGIAARPRGAHPRQQRLFPRPRRADAARGAVQRLVQPAPGRGSRLSVRRTRH